MVSSLRQFIETVRFLTTSLAALALLGATLAQAQNAISPHERLAAERNGNRMGSNIPRGTILISISSAGARKEYRWSFGVLQSVDELGQFVATDEVLPWEFLHRDQSGDQITLMSPFSFSEDRKLLAAVFLPTAALSEGLQKRSNLVIIDAETKSEVARASVHGREIARMAWSPTSEYLAIVTFEQWLGKWPHEWLSALFGHPAPHNNYFLEIRTQNLVPVFTAPIAQDMRQGTAFIVWKQIDGVRHD